MPTVEVTATEVVAMEVVAMEVTVTVAAEVMAMVDTEEGGLLMLSPKLRLLPLPKLLQMLNPDMDMDVVMDMV